MKLKCSKVLTTSFNMSERLNFLYDDFGSFCKPSRLTRSISIQFITKCTQKEIFFFKIKVDDSLQMPGNKFEYAISGLYAALNVKPLQLPNSIDLISATSAGQQFNQRSTQIMSHNTRDPASTIRLYLKFVMNKIPGL